MNLPFQYQNTMVNDVIAKLNNGYNRITVLIMTGGGKTVIMSDLANRIVDESKKDVLVLFDMKVMLEQGKHRIENSKKIHYKMISELSRQTNIKRLPKYDYVILADLNAATRNRNKDLIGLIGKNIISFGTPYEFSKRDEYIVSQKVVPIEKELTQTAVLDDITLLRYPTCQIYVTKNIIDVRDAAVADQEEKKKLKSQIRKQKIEINKMKDDAGKEINRIRAESSNKEYGKIKQLENKIEDLEFSLEVNEQIFQAMGISGVMVANTAEKIIELRLAFKKTINEGISQATKESLQKNFQDDVAEILLGFAHHSRNELTTLQYESILISSLTKEVWNKLDKKSKTFLITAKLVYDGMSSMKGDLDYSGICLSVTKAVEVEFAKRFYEKYINYLKEKYPWPQQKEKWPKCALNKSKTDILGCKDFSLGSIMHIAGIVDGEAREPSKTEFREFARRELYKKHIRDSEIEEKVSHCVSVIEKIRNDYRNPAAHRAALTILTAKECLDYVIDTQMELKEILIDYRK